MCWGNGQDPSQGHGFHSRSPLSSLGVVVGRAWVSFWQELPTSSCMCSAPCHRRWRFLGMPPRPPWAEALSLCLLLPTVSIHFRHASPPHITRCVHTFQACLPPPYHPLCPYISGMPSHPHIIHSTFILSHLFLLEPNWGHPEAPPRLLGLHPTETSSGK